MTVTTRLFVSYAYMSIFGKLKILAEKWKKQIEILTCVKWFCDSKILRVAVNSWDCEVVFMEIYSWAAIMVILFFRGLGIIWNILSAYSRKFTKAV